jgi:hypothetical protein
MKYLAGFDKEGELEICVYVFVSEGKRLLLSLGKQLE